jgi:hypothetical protein
MKLAKKKSFNEWVTIGDDKFLIDYPTREQNYKLKQIFLELNDIPMKDGVLLYDQMTPEQIARIAIADKKYMELYLKVTIKDWQIIDVDGNPVKCVLVNNELDKGLFDRMCESLSQEDLTIIYQAISKELEFNESDKKKLNG